MAAVPQALAGRARGWTVSAEQLAFEGPGRAFAPAAVMTAHHGRNDVMIASVARLYIPDGATVLDATWGKGNFWTRTDTGRFRLIGSDVASPSAQVRADFRVLPFRSSSLDVVVLDPPYVLRPERGRFIDVRYRNSETTEGITYTRMLSLYEAGLAEAARVLRRGGTCWVKCQDATENRCQRWAVVDMPAVATASGMAPRDLFVLVNPTPPGGMRAERQHQARRNHSYLWIFTKPRGRSRT
jgi:hypothetical protein